MTPRTALLAAWTIFAAAVCAVVIIGAVIAAAPKPDSVWFQCRNGICIAPAEQVDALIEYVWHLEKLASRDCFLKKVGNENL